MCESEKIAHYKELLSDKKLIMGKRYADTTTGQKCVVSLATTIGFSKEELDNLKKLYSNSTKRRS